MAIYWTAGRKAEIIDRIRKGEDQAMLLAQHEISDEEFEAWKSAYARGGIDGLFVLPRVDGFRCGARAKRRTA